MVDPVMLLAFVPAGLALNLTPGADMMLCLGQGLRSGPRAAWAASAGIALGAFIHTFLAGLGLGAVVATVPAAFEVIRWVGVAYLLWLAVQTLRHAGQAADMPIVSTARAFRTGLIVNLTNPKVILFVLAFVPQFVVPEAGSVLLQFLIFGAILSAGGFVINGAVGVFAGGAGQRFARGSRVLDWLSASVFAGLALRLAILERT
ncbi:LysE family translocator [uncultured Tateyamaria sp.]|uniref:LysE family translocator n=1 Tax=uncultured Tateyamaria sp. TaxID=455651 RepID=UPI0026120091|nr:LysE family translocator [uncultured Tateyamaria sp.]